MILVVVVAFAAPNLQSQTSRPQVTISPLVASDGVHAGGPVRTALHVRLPEGIHTQSNKPRDPLLIPTAISFNVPKGVTIDEIVWPPTTDFKLAGQSAPLAVFEHEFTVGVQLTLGPDVAAGNLIVPAHLRYQACNDQVYFAPTTANTEWVLKVVPQSTNVAALVPAVLDGIPFGKGEAPSPQSLAPPIAAPKVEAGDTGLARLDKFEVRASTGGYLLSGAFLEFVQNAERGVAQKGMFEGQAPIAILLIVFLGGLALNLTPCVLPMIPINLAIIGARAPRRDRGGGDSFSDPLMALPWRSFTASSA